MVASSPAAIGHWQGPLVTEGEWTGDNRFFEPGSLEWDTGYLPFPLRWAPVDNGGHDGAVHVAWIENVDRQGNQIWGSGPVFDQGFMDYLNAAGKAGVSIDADEGTLTVEVVMPDGPSLGTEEPQPGTQYGIPKELSRYQQARLRAATVVDIPAFVSAYVEPAGNLGELAPAEVAGTVVPDEGLVAAAPALVDEIPVPAPEAAGVALFAEDTGRVLMTQRALSPDDPNGGKWELPGGGIDSGETPEEAARREFGEETGNPLPQDATLLDTYVSDNGVYACHVFSIPAEASVSLGGGGIVNPDDPDGDFNEALAFWDVSHIQGDHIRPEVLSMDWAQINPFDQDGAAADDAIVEEFDVAAPVPEPPVKKMASPSAEDTTYLTALLAHHHDVETLTTEYLQQADQADPVAVFAQEVLQCMNEYDQQINNMLGVAPETPTAADALVASAAPVAPPDEWFEPFDLEGATPLTVTADGRVFGHLATWDSCHRGGQFSGQCVKPPSDPKAPFFQLGEVVTASGATVDVGVVTLGGGHFTKNGAITSIEHMDDVTTAAAVVVVREDDYGIGLFGSITSDATPAMVAALRRSPLSAAWRKERGKYRLVGAHAVNVPGHPVTRTLVASVSPEAFVVFGRPEAKPADGNVVDLRSTARRLAVSAGLDNASLVASVRSRMSDLDCGCDDDEEPALVASVSGDTELPLAPYEMGWDGGEATARVFEHYKQGDTVDEAAVGKAFLWRNTDHPADQKQGWDLPFADIVDGQLKIVPRGVQATAGGHGVGQLDQINGDDEAAIKGKIGTLYSRIKTAYPDAPDNPFL